MSDQTIKPLGGQTYKRHQKLSVRERFMLNIEPCPMTGCWLWLGRDNGVGYGRMSVAGKPLRAHRVSYELFRGPVAAHLTVDHLCRTRGCVNPDHLEAVTRGVNCLRGVGATARNAQKTHCVHGHPLSGQNLLISQRKNGAPFRRCRTCRDAKA